MSTLYPPDIPQDSHGRAIPPVIHLDSYQPNAIEKAHQKVAARRARIDRDTADRAEVQARRDIGLRYRMAHKIPLMDLADELADWAPPGDAGNQAVAVAENAIRVAENHVAHPDGGFCLACGPGYTWPCFRYVDTHHNAMQALRSIGRPRTA